MEDMEGLKDTRVVLTGGVGFIGSHLAEELVRLGVRVTIPYITIETNSYFLSRNLQKKTTVQKVDITDRQKLTAFIEKTQPHYIFHLAAQTLVTKAYKHPYETLNTNIMGTVNLLEIMRSNTDIKGLIVASSDKAYGKTTKAYSESSSLKGDHPYDVSKSAADLICQAYYKTYKTPVVITRFGNVYGEGDLHFDRIVPGICKSVVRKEPLEIRSDGTFVRDYIYVKDVMQGYLTLLKNCDSIHGEAFNFSSPDTLSVLDLIKIAEKALGEKVEYKIINSAKNEIPYQHLDDGKVRKLGWKNSHTVESTLPQVFRWYKDLLEK